MSETGSSPAPAIQICKDKMMLTVTNVRPAIQKKTDQEARQEMSARLYHIFIKYT